MTEGKKPVLDHRIGQFAFEDIPLGCDLLLSDESHAPQYAMALIASVEGRLPICTIGGMASVTAHGMAGGVMLMSWYPGGKDRFLQVRIRLPETAFVLALADWRTDTPPCIFVKDGWLSGLYGRSHRTYVLLDTIKDANVPHGPWRAADDSSSSRGHALRRSWCSCALP